MLNYHSHRCVAICLCSTASRGMGLFVPRPSLLPYIQRAWEPAPDTALTSAQPGHRRRNVERTLVQWQCWIFVASWTGVIKYHGPRPESVRPFCSPRVLC